MPTVRAGDLPYQPYNTEVPSSQVPSTYQTERATPEDFGAGIGLATERLGATIERGANQFAENAIARQQQANKVAADDLTNQYQDFETKLLYGDPDNPGDTGFFGKKGQDALDAMPLVRNSLLQKREEFRKVLQNDQQRLLFDSETRRLQSYTLASVGRHYVSENNTYEHAVADAKIKSGLTSAAQSITRDVDDEAGFNEGVHRAMTGFLEDAQRQGLANSSDYVNQGLQKIRGEAVKYKAEALALKNPLAAAEFIRNNIDALSGDEGNQLLGRYRARAGSLQADIDNEFAEPPKQRGSSDKYDGSHMPKGTSAGLLGKYATGNAVVGGPSGVEGVNPIFAQRIDTMVSAMPPDIQQKFNIISGYRSQERQEQVNPSVKNSHHSHGMAVDTTNDPDVINWINQNGTKYGVGYTLNYMPNEQNHLEPTEGGERIPLEEVGSWASFNSKTHPTDKAPDRVDNWEVRHNNFGGIRKPGITAGPNQGGFEEYSTPQVGVQAIMNKLHQWATVGVTTAMNPTGGPLQSLRQIISVWAPPTENDTGDLIDRAVKLTGFGPDDRLDLNDPGVMGKVTEAIIRGEHGGKLPVSPTVIANVAGQSAGLTAARTQQQPLVQLASNSPDSVILPQTPKPLPKLDFLLPPLDAGELPDAQVPGMSEQLEKIMKNVPADEVERRNNAVKRARQVLNQQYQDQQRQLRVHNEQVKAQSEATQDEYMQRLSKGEQVDTRQILGDSRMTPEHRREMVKFVERENKQDPASLVSKRNTVELLDNIWNSKITEETPLKDAYLQGNITYQDFEKVRKEFRDQRSAGGETLKEQKHELMGAVTNRILGPYAVDKEGEAMDEVAASREGRPSAKMRVYNFIADMNSKIDEYQKAGKNPRDLFDPKNPAFIGSPENLKRFEPSIKQKVEDGKTNINKPVEQMTPAELIDFAKRATNDADYARAVAEGARRGLIAPPTPPPIPGPQAPIAR